MNKWFVVIFIVLLGGCSSHSNETSQLYLLPSSTVTTLTPRNDEQELLIVNPVEIADYLSGIGLVYQVNDTKIIQAKKNLWAENVNKQLTRNLIQELRFKQNHFWVTKWTAASSASNTFHLQVNIEQFNSKYTGDAVVSGEWQLFNNEKELVKAVPFNFLIELKHPGYEAQVSSLAKGVDLLTSQIAEYLK